MKLAVILLALTIIFFMVPLFFNSATWQYLEDLALDSYLREVFSFWFSVFKSIISGSIP